MPDPALAEVADDGLAGPRAAVARGEWAEAVQLLDAAGDAATEPEGLELRAHAEYGAGRFEAAVTAWEDLHAAFLAAGNAAEAGRVAATIGMYLMMDTGLMAPVRGWLRRADQLVADQPDAPAHALIALGRTYERFMCGDMDAAGEQAARAIELGERLGVAPAAVIGRVAAARVLIFAGDVAGGLAQLDDLALLLMSGEVDPLTTGMMYCELICAAQGLARYDRAAEWTELMERWRPHGAVGGLSGRCRVHRAEMLRLRGPGEAAEEEALAACEELRPWMRREFGWPLVELGNIRLRRGDLAGAEEAFAAAHQHAWSPHPGLALLRLEDGDVAAAGALIADAIAHPLDVPWKERPPSVELQRAPLLDAQAEIAAAAGDADTARRAAEALAAIARTYDSAGLLASSDLASARAALVEGDHEAAIVAGGRAVTGWANLSAPFETAMARTVLGDAYEASGATDAARMEWRAAKDAFAAFGARRWTARLEQRLGAGPAASPGAAAAPMPTPTRATFTCAGGIRTVAFEGQAVTLADLKGFRYLARLLAEPGREFHTRDLIAVEHGTLPGQADAVAADAGLRRSGQAGLPVLDDQARAAYRRRLREIDEDIDDARRNHDPGRLALAERDREYLLAELARDVGLGGRHRTVGGDAERARTSVTRSLRYALGRLAEHHPRVAAHLQPRVRTGTYCSYAPDPLTPIDWRV